jgi:peroxiredoxin
LQLELANIQSLGARLIAISPQLPDQSLSLKEKENLEFPVLSDVGNEVAEKFGLVYVLPEILRPVYAKWGLNIPEANGDDSFKLPIPATYVIDKNKNIVLDFIEINHTQRLEPSFIIDALKDLSV